MENKELLMNAINDYSLYADHQKKILKLLVNMAVDDVIIVSASELHELTKSAITNIYKAISLFEKDGILEPIKDVDGLVRMDSYKLNTAKVENILNHYLKKEVQKNLFKKRSEKI